MGSRPRRGGPDSGQAVTPEAAVAHPRDQGRRAPQNLPNVTGRKRHPPAINNFRLCTPPRLCRKWWFTAGRDVARDAIDIGLDVSPRYRSGRAGASPEAVNRPPTSLSYFIRKSTRHSERGGPGERLGGLNCFVARSRRGAVRAKATSRKPTVSSTANFRRVPSIGATTIAALPSPRPNPDRRATTEKRRRRSRPSRLKVCGPAADGSRQRIGVRFGLDTGPETGSWPRWAVCGGPGRLRPVVLFLGPQPSYQLAKRQ